MVSSEYLEDFLDLLPLSEPCQNLLEREILLFDLLRKGCTNVHWVVIRKDAGPNLVEEFAARQDYSHAINFFAGMMGFGLIMAFLSLLLKAASPTLWGVLIFYAGMVLYIILSLLQKGHTKAKNELARERETMSEIPARMSRLKTAWSQVEVEDRKKFKQFFLDMVPTYEIEDLSAQFQLWKENQSKKPEQKEKKMADEYPRSKTHPFTLAFSDDQNGKELIVTDFVGYADEAMLLIERDGSVACNDDQDENGRWLFFLKNSAGEKINVPYNKGYSRLEIFYAETLVYRYDFSGQVKEFRDKRVIGDFFFGNNSFGF